MIKSALSKKMRGLMLVLAVGLLWTGANVWAAEVNGGGEGGIGGGEVVGDGLGWSELIALVFFFEPTTRWVFLSTTCLGFAGGMVGSFLLLRKRSLMGDALSHAMLPGVPVAFMVMVGLGGTGKWMPGLLLGVAVFGLIGVCTVLGVIRYTRIKIDAAMGIVLSVFFGLGLSLLQIAARVEGGEKAGLSHYIYGKVSAIDFVDSMTMMGVSGGVVLLCFVFYKEFKMICFDDVYAKSQGWATGFLDLLMLAVVTLITVVGLQAVGIILIIALFVIPAAAARFWTDRLLGMMFIASGIGAFSGWVGAVISAVAVRMPAGAIIVLVASFIFLLSLFFGSARGLVVRAMRRRRLNRHVARQHLMRAFFEHAEKNEHARGQEVVEAKQTKLDFQRLLEARSWTRQGVKKEIKRGVKFGLIVALGEEVYRLTDRGLIEARRHVRNHRLWEMYLITYADIAPSHVDRDADRVEHVLGQAMVQKLEGLLESAGGSVLGGRVPANPHGHL